jgi:hypothetical protein
MVPPHLNLVRLAKNALGGVDHIKPFKLENRDYAIPEVGFRFSNRGDVLSPVMGVPERPNPPVGRDRSQPGRRRSPQIAIRLFALLSRLSGRQKEPHRPVRSVAFFAQTTALAAAAFFALALRPVGVMVSRLRLPPFLPILLKYSDTSAEILRFCHFR